MKDKTSFSAHLYKNQYVWLITGVAGFIGSNLLEELLLHDQVVIGIDNFETGFEDNLIEVEEIVSSKQWKNFIFHKIDINHFSKILPLFQGVDYVLHQAALGSVPRSIKNPLKTNETNISGFLNVIEASRESNIKAFIYAASSSTYGDHKTLPKKENVIGKPLSPYAITKYANELYAGIFSQHYDMNVVGLRYFNVFGKRQDPNGAYAAVIPKWIGAILSNQDVYINGDGSTTRDFCYVKNAIQANILSALTINDLDKASVFNIAYGESNSLNTLFEEIIEIFKSHEFIYTKDPIYRGFREGDIKDSLADISLAKNSIQYNPLYNLQSGLKETIDWFLSK